MEQHLFLVVNVNRKKLFRAREWREKSGWSSPRHVFHNEYRPIWAQHLHLCHWKYALYVFMSSSFSVLGAQTFNLARRAKQQDEWYSVFKEYSKKKSKKLLCSKACILKKMYLLILRKQWCELDHTLVLWIKLLLAL